MKNGGLIAAVVLLILVAGITGFLVLNNNDDSTSDQSNDITNQNALTTSSTSDTTNETSEFSPNAPTGDQEGQITVSMQNYSYSPSVIEVKAGTTVTFNLNSEEGMHDFVVDELGIKSSVLNAGENETLTVEIPADATGEYSFYCSVGNHRALGMEGTLRVIE